MWKGAGDNYIEVVETGGLLIPNAVTLIKVGREGEEGGCKQQGPNSIQNRRKKKLVIYLIGNQSSYAARNPVK